ncbi:hypothetical protein [Paenibacillus lautus]|uniref:hypothetical protein n=1 Tax=Paenibacillus lautus TaxID=1401 RepID=UPI003D2A7537
MKDRRVRSQFKGFQLIVDKHEAAERTNRFRKSGSGRLCHRIFTMDKYSKENPRATAIEGTIRTRSVEANKVYSHFWILI